MSAPRKVPLISIQRSAKPAGKRERGVLPNVLYVVTIMALLSGGALTATYMLAVEAGAVFQSALANPLLSAEALDRWRETGTSLYTLAVGISSHVLVGVISSLGTLLIALRPRNGEPK